LDLDPHRATGRQRHHAATPAAAATPAKDKMAAKLRTAAGRALYALAPGLV
jgi:hypothetical protein